MSKLSKLSDHMLDKVVDEMSTSPEKKELRKSTAAMVITQMQEMGSGVRTAMRARHTAEQALWITANPNRPQDDTDAGWKAMTDMQYAEMNQNLKTWGLPQLTKSPLPTP